MIEATEYAEVGMALVSIPTGRKGPSSKGWNKLDNVITDPQKASALEGNIGLAHAYSRSIRCRCYLCGELRKPLNRLLDK